MSCPLVIRFEDAELVVVEKPAGVHTAPLRAAEGSTLLERVIESYPEVAQLPGIKAMEPGLLHRLDRETSGLVAVARTPAAFAALREIAARGGMRKEYLAACARPAHGGPGDGGQADAAAAGSALSIASRFAPYGSGGRMVRIVLAGETRAKLLRNATPVSYSTEAEIIRQGPAALLLRARLDRGFRHQVRAHLSFLGFPILGDHLYGTPVPPGAVERLYLHASFLHFAHPGTGAPISVESPLPEEFAALFE